MSQQSPNSSKGLNRWESLLVYIFAGAAVCMCIGVTLSPAIGEWLFWAASYVTFISWILMVGSLTIRGIINHIHHRR